LEVKLRGDDLRKLLNEWEMTLAGMKEVPQENILQSLFRTQIENYSGLRAQISYYDRLEVGHMASQDCPTIFGKQKAFADTRRTHQR
jgi:hypothetical protein